MSLNHQRRCIIRIHADWWSALASVKISSNSFVQEASVDLWPVDAKAMTTCRAASEYHKRQQPGSDCYLWNAPCRSHERAERPHKMICCSFTPRARKSPSQRRCGDSCRLIFIHFFRVYLLTGFGCGDLIDELTFTNENWRGKSVLLASPHVILFPQKWSFMKDRRSLASTLSTDQHVEISLASIALFCLCRP
jgi:hypothetical protein